MRDPASLDLYRRENFRITRVDAPGAIAEYQEFLREHYEPLGFFCQQVLPGAGSRLFQLRHGAALAAIFRLTPVQDPDSPYYRVIPGARAPGGELRPLLEVNNVVIARRFRASIALGLLLYHSACAAIAGGYAFVVGMNRFQILRFFVDFGVVPAEHPPESLLGKEHLLDFVNYYDTADPASIAYMHERARRWFHQELVMQTLRRNYVLPRRSRPAGPGTGAGAAAADPYPATLASSGASRAQA